MFTVTLAIWKEVVNGDELKVVVQTYRHWFLGLGKMDAGGFTMNDAGVVRDLKREDLYEFI